MKKLRKILLVLPLLVFIGCSNNNEDTENGSENKLVGKWYLIEQINSSGNTITFDECSSKTNNVFNSNGSYIEEEYTENNNTCTLAYKGTGKYELLDDDIIYINLDNDGNFRLKVKFISSNRKETTLINGNGITNIWVKK